MALFIRGVIYMYMYHCKYNNHNVLLTIFAQLLSNEFLPFMREIQPSYFKNLGT
jgi:hypothetical protein